MFFLNLSDVPKKSTPGKFAYLRILFFQRIGINATKFEKTQVTFSLANLSRREIEAGSIRQWQCGAYEITT